ncbi:DNA mismatch repair protein MutT [Sorangium cellulosum]|uniref:GDP-mannose pyrophosphatase n=1 Tax=Sorangium cellulosum TaxID=56 RepID=A0A2L0F3S0_SORCE|nr:NUDIX hydrolase [Sorangium cellulosum]AUX46173.1 DNA mismatch repair protein MutT [Sorangium cellulosum]
MGIIIPRRRASAMAGSFGPLAVHRHDVVAADVSYPCFTLELADWISVAAITDAGEFVLVRQYRHGVDAVTIETAGGIIDPGEEPARAALRELQEETGYAAASLEPLGWVHPNTALQANRCHLYLARGARLVGEPDGDEHESTEAVVMTASEVTAAMQDGRISHSLSVVTLLRALPLATAAAR